MYVGRRKIQKLMDNSKRAGMTDDGKKLGEFDLVDRLARTELQKQHVCLYYRKDDSTADPSSSQPPRCGQRLNRTRLGPHLLRCQRRLLADDHLRRGLPQRRRTLRAQRP